MHSALKIEYAFPIKFLPLCSCKNIAISVKKAKLTQPQNGVRITVIMDIFNVTDYLYAGSRVGKEHADELFFTPISVKKLIVGVEAADPRRWYIQIQIKAFEKYWQKRSLLWKRK